MNATHHNPFTSIPPLALRIGMGAAAAGSLLFFMAAAATLGGCASDDQVGHTKTVEKRVVDTPTEKVTTTETKEKDTHYVR
ncbi:MAG: hypothetical protein QM783_12925 [Phycisphaerales bacterium]